MFPGSDAWRLTGTNKFVNLPLLKEGIWALGIIVAQWRMGDWLSIITGDYTSVSSSVLPYALDCCSEFEYVFGP